MIFPCMALFSVLTFCSADRLQEKIYSSINGLACFRRLNGTHQFGCSSTTESGSVGAVHWIREVEDARWAAEGGGGGGPYVPVISMDLINISQAINILVTKPDHIAGLLLYVNGTETPQYDSPDSQCPNQYSSGPGSQCEATSSDKWNPHGSDLLRTDIPFPIFYLPPAMGEEVNKLLDCYQRFNEMDRDSQAGRPLCSVQLSSFMYAAVNTQVCQRRSGISYMTNSKQCDPLGDRNIHSSLFPRSKNATEANRTVVLVTTRIDSASLFDGVSPGAAGSAVGIVTLLTAASTLSKMLPANGTSTSNNVMWALFSGETFDYIGSQRVAYDMSKGAWPEEAPLSPTTVALHVELGQLGGALGHRDDGNWNLTSFAPLYNSPEDEEVRTFITMLQRAESKLNFLSEMTSNLPPSSLHSFRRILGESPAAGGLPELVLVDHGPTFTNRYYQSVFDDKRNIGFVYANVTVDQMGNFLDTDTMISLGHLTDKSAQVKVSRLANALSHALYEKVTGNVYTGNHSASAHMVDELLHCYTEMAHCRMFLASAEGPSEVASDIELPKEPYPLYTGVSTWNTQVPATTGILLALLTGAQTNHSREECFALDSKYTVNWLNGWNNTGVCVLSNVNFTDALSPAFIIPGYDYSSGEYSTWTESIWRGLFARMFVAPSGRGARIAGLLGAVSTLLVGMMTYWIHRHSDVIFAKPNQSVVITDPSTTGILRTVNC